jgi:hypothetical protein
MSIRNYEKNNALMLGTSDYWSMSRLSHWPSKSVYYIEDWRIYNHKEGSDESCLGVPLTKVLFSWLSMEEQNRDSRKPFESSLFSSLYTIYLPLHEYSKLLAIFICFA